MNTPNLRDFLPELQQIWDALVHKDTLPEIADAIVVGGCWDLGLAERAAELYHAGVSDIIVVSGYKPENLNTTEAEVLAGRCVELGVPKEAIELEKEASNTGQNILFSARMLSELITNVENVVLIHKPFMSLRFLATAEAQWPAPQPHFYTTCQTISFEDYCKINEFEAVYWEMLGYFKRMDEYAVRGFQTAQPIPDSAREAFDKIMSAGFATR